MSKRKRGLAWIAVAVIVIGVLIANRFVRDNSIQQSTKHKQAQKIAVLGDSLVEICLTLGLNKNLVAVSYLGKDIPELKGIKHLGGPQNLSEEELIAVNADLIIVSDSVQLKQRIKSTLANDKINKLLLKHDTYNDITHNILEISKAMGIEDRGLQLVKSLNEKINVKRVVHKNAPRILLVYSANQDEGEGFKSFACIDRETFLDEILQSAGGVNAITNSKKSWPQISIEDLIQLNPDIILDIRPDCELHPYLITSRWEETVPPGSVNAIDNKEVHLINNHYALLPSPKIVDIHDEIKKIIDDYMSKQS